MSNHAPYCNKPIGVFDSGVGGLSVLKQISLLLPNEHLIYFADSAYAPYGDKSTEFIKKRSKQLAQYLIDLNIKALVVACNTATTEAITDIRKYIDIPVIGVEPAIKPATALSKNKSIGVMATHRTINSSRYRKLLQEHADNVQVYNIVCHELADIIEKNPKGNSHSLELIKQYTHEVCKNNTDIIVLGCTHYPFITEQIQAVVGQHVTILETGKPVAAQVKNIIEKNHLTCSQSNQGKVDFFSSLDNKAHKNSIYQLWGEKVNISIALQSTSIPE